jgi:hypothetical protein
MDRKCEIKLQKKKVTTRTHKGPHCIKCMFHLNLLFVLKYHKYYCISVTEIINVYFQYEFIHKVYNFV